MEAPAQLTGEELDTLRQQVRSLAESVESLRVQMAGQSKVISELAAQMGAAKALTPSPPQPQAVAADTAVSPEVLIVIAAAVTMFLGKKVRIRSAKMLQSPYEIVNPWAQQGRVNVQASHFLRGR
jgi:hypothetical protein